MEDTIEEEKDKLGINNGDAGETSVNNNTHDAIPSRESNDEDIITNDDKDDGIQDGEGHVVPQQPDENTENNSKEKEGELSSVKQVYNFK